MQPLSLVSFGTTIMQALQLLWLVKKHEDETVKKSSLYSPSHY